MWQRIKKIWKIVKILWRSERLEHIEEIIPVLKDSKNEIVMFSNESEVNSPNEIMMFITGDFLNVPFAAMSREVIKNNIVRTIGKQQYEQNLEQLDYDLAMAYKEADYQMARNEALDAEFMYYREVNNPNGMKSQQLLNMWNRVVEMKERLKRFEEDVDAKS